MLLENFERARIAAALDRSQGNITAAARELGIHRQSLQQKMGQLGIKRASDDGFRQRIVLSVQRALY